MKHIYRIILGLSLGLLLFMLASCEDWLNVKPKTEIDSEELFESEYGFKEALAGIYTAITKENLYGKELTFGFNDALAQQWNIASINNEYFSIKTYNFSDIKAELKIDSIWSEAYNAVANINAMLNVIDSKKSIFSDNNYNIIKGEGLALRAYIHFDMLRLFSDINFTGDGEKHIPYVDTLVAGITVKDNSKVIIEKAINDLEKASVLLENDPVRSGDSSPDTYFANRNYHMNYYAVKGLMARIYLYMGNKEAAFNAANEVIMAQKNKGLFPWVKSSDITRSESELRDRTFSTEHLFALNIRKMKEYIEKYFRSTSNNLLTREAVGEIYEGIEEYRKQYLFESSGTEANVPSKLWQMENKDNSVTDLPKKNRMPMIRISEMYYIAAEAKLETPDVAVKYINEVRRHRGIDVELPTNISSTEVLVEIEKEYKKEFICEGQLFFFYKRLNFSSIGGMPVDNYVIPTPLAEDEYRGN